jgi:hypothetical protein
MLGNLFSNSAVLRIPLIFLVCVCVCVCMRGSRMLHRSAQEATKYATFWYDTVTIICIRLLNHARLLLQIPKF